MGRFESCEIAVGREYNHFQEVNALNLASIVHFCSLLLLTLLFFNKNSSILRFFHRFGIHLSILPSYFDYILALNFTYLIFGIFFAVGHRLQMLSIFLAIETGVERMFDEGLTFFLMQYGAGFNGLRKATLYASIWGLIVIVLFLILDHLERSHHSHHHHGFAHRSLIGRFVFYSCLTVFYSCLIVLPIEWVHRRPALKPFAYFQVITNLLYIVVVVCYWLQYDVGFCFLFGTTTIIEGIGSPIFIFITLSFDSEFWQGIGRNMSSHPLAGVWELEIETVTTIGQKLADIEKITSTKEQRKLPIIHFGLIQLDEHLGYVAGGLSRVYFGYIKKKPVAIKILFAMELTPQVVTSFYDEIQILYSLQHTNVITCLGISVMPPAVCVILEHCKYGSLFDYLYKPVYTNHNVTVPINTMKTSDVLVTELSSFPKRNNNEGVVSAASAGMIMNDDMNVLHSNHQSPPLLPPPPPTTPTITPHGLDSNGTTPANAANAKRTSRTTEDFSVQKRSSKTLDEILAKKRSSRPNDELSTVHLKRPSHPEGKTLDETHLNPLQELTKPSEDHSYPAQSTGSFDVRKKSVLERASSYVDSVFGRTPKDRPSILIDPERYSTSHNDRMKFLMEGKSATTAQAPEVNDITAGEVRRSSMASNLSTPTLHSLNLFTITKPKIKASEMRSIGTIEKFEMIVGACRGLAFLHEKGYMHCDLKSPNFLVSNDKVMKLADLGEARPIDSTKLFLSLPNPAMNWRPPEMMNPNISLRFYSPASDVYSLSMVISEILNQEIPLDHIFHSHTMEECFHQIVEWNARPSIPEWVPEDFQHMLQRAWHTDPYLRPSCQEFTASAERSLQFLLRSDSLSVV